MSKLIDKLNQVSQTGFHPMGFRVSQSASQKLRMLLVAGLAKVDVNNLADYVAGADAGLLDTSQLGSGAGVIQKLAQAASAIPWGIWLKDKGQDDIKQIVKAGCDFVIFTAMDTPLAILQDDEVGKILEVAPSLGDGLLRTLNELPVDAILITLGESENSILTWQHLMLFQRFAGFLTKPLFVCVPSNVTAKELQAIWGAGVDGIIVEVRAGQSPKRLGELRKIIDKLVLPSQSKRKQTAALLPYVGEQAETEIEEEEEE